MSGEKNNLPNWIWYKLSIIAKTPKEGGCESRLRGDNFKARVTWVLSSTVFDWQGQGGGESWGCQRSIYLFTHFSPALYSTHCVTYIGSLLFFTLQGLYIVPQISSIDLLKFYIISPKALYHLHLLQMPATTEIRLILSSYMCNLPLCKPKALCLIWAALWRTVLPSLCVCGMVK